MIVYKSKKAALTEKPPQDTAVLVAYVQKVAPQRCFLILSAGKDRKKKWTLQIFPRKST